MYRLKKGLKVITFVAIAVVLLYGIQRIVAAKFDASQGLRTGFEQEEENSIDVLFCGTSNMFHTINPLFLYEETGITAFDFGSSSQSLNMSYMYLKQALKSQKPSVVCLEVLASRDDFNRDLYEPGMRWGFTYFPSSGEKYQGLYQQLGKVDAEYLSYVFPILRYKDRWKELSENDFKDHYTTMWKGCKVSYEVTEVEYTDAYTEDLDWEIADSNVEALDKIRALCEENGIELVLFKSPTPTLWKQVYSQRISEYAEENSLVFIDYNDKLRELGIDVKTDFMDAGHVNISGSRKITADMGEYLKSHFALEDHRDGEDNSWDKALEEKARRESDSAIKNASDLGSFVNALSDEEYTILYSVSGEIGEEQQALLGNYFKQEDGFVEGCVRVNGDTVLNVSNHTEYSWHDTYFGQDYALDCVLSEDENGTETWQTGIYVNGNSGNLVGHGINVIVVDNRLREEACRVGFDADNGYAVVR